MPPEAGARAKELAAAFAVEPRDFRTKAGGRAQDWVEKQLTIRGWPAERLKTWPGAVYACQPGATTRVVLFMAHTDTVPGVIGGNDNAAAVGVLLAAAELLSGLETERTVCLAFPDAEEHGLRGSFALEQAARNGALGGPIDQAMSLDLVGVGTLTHNGLGPPFGRGRLSALLRAGPAEVPWMYRAVSHARPTLERSDHYAFNERGIPASHLMARGPQGFDWRYHSPADTVEHLQTDTLQQAVEVVVGVASAPSLPREEVGSPAFVVPFTAIALPGWATWFGFAAAGLGWLAGLGPVPTRHEAATGAATWIAQAVVATVALGLAMFVALGFRRMDLALTGPVCLAGWAAWGAVALGSPLESPPIVGRALGGALALGLALWLAVIGAPLVGLPLAIAALAIGLSRWLPALALLAAWPAAYLFRPDGIRELHFHTLFPADVFWWTALAGILLVPLLGGLQTAPQPHRRNVATVLAIVAVAAIVFAWVSPEQVAPFLDHR